MATPIKDLISENLSERECAQLSIGLIGDPKPFIVGTEKDTTNSFKILDPYTPVVFTSLKEKNRSGEVIDWATIIAGEEISKPIVSEQGYYDVEISQGVLRGISVRTLV